MDTGFGSVRDRVADEIRDIFGGVQASISGGGDDPLAWSVSLGERRVMSVGALVLAFVLGALLGAVLSGGK